MTITMGIPTYNGSNRVKLLLSSIHNYTGQEEMRDVEIVVCDDGTPDFEEYDKLEEVCSHYQASLIRHSENRGISVSWNDLARFQSCDLVILLNDDIQICHPAWLKCLEYFFENNENIGHISFPTFNLDPRTALPRPEQTIPDITIKPWLSWTPGGQAFAFKRTVFDKVNGFWESLKSFYEETDFGYKTAYKGYLSYVLSFPVVFHWGSQTFGLNNELTLTTPIDKNLSMAKYRQLLKSKFSEKKIEPCPGKVYRLEYSRALFALKWKCNDLWDAPQDEIENDLKKNIRKQLIKWLDKDENEREALI